MCNRRWLLSFICVHMYTHIYTYRYSYTHTYTCGYSLSAHFYHYLCIGIYINICIPICIQREREKRWGCIPSKIECGHSPGKILWGFFQLTLLHAHSLTCNVLGTRDAKMNHTSVLSSWSRPELEMILMSNIALVDVFNIWKHWGKKQNLRITKPSEPSLGTSALATPSWSGGGLKRWLIGGRSSWRKLVWSQPKGEARLYGEARPGVSALC